MEYKEALAHTQSLVQGSSRLKFLSEEAIARFANSLWITWKGNSEDFRTPLWNEAPRSDIISMLLDILKEGSYPDILLQDEQSVNDVGPKSLMKPWVDRQQDADAYFSAKPEVDNEHVRYACNKLLSLIQAHSIRPLSIDNAVERLPKKTQWGLPFMMQGTESWEKHLELAKAIKSLEDSFASIVYWRGQAKREQTKNRIVWGTPHSVGILEAMCMYPVLQVLRSVRGFSAWGTLYDVDCALSRILVKPGVKYSSDYSKFDTSPSEQLGHFVWDVLRHWLIPAVSGLLDLLEEIFFRSDLIVPFKVMTGRRGCVPSGSVLTNLFDSLMNLLLGFYIESRLGTELEDYEVMGDDSVFYFPSQPSVGEIADAVSECGFEMNPDKQMVEEHKVHFCQRLHCLDYTINGVHVGVRSPIRALSGLTGHERLERNLTAERVSASALLQVQDCVNHPLFSNFVEFYYSGDRLVQSGKDPMAIVREAGGPEQVLSDRGRGAFPYLTHDPSGFENFEVVRIIRELQRR
jgi:hypothetical protein